MTTPTTAPVPAQSELREAMQDAIDLLVERTHGHPARSPGHNARLLLERALADDAASRRSPIAPTAVKAEPELTAGLCPRCAGTGKDTYSTGIQCWKCSGTGAVVIRSALSPAAEPAPMNKLLNPAGETIPSAQGNAREPEPTTGQQPVGSGSHPAEPAPVEMDEPVAWLRIRSDGRRTFWETNVDGDCTPLYRRPQPAEGWREALTLIRHFADTINERNYADKRLYLLQHIDRLLASPSREPDSGAVLDGCLNVGHSVMKTAGYAFPGEVRAIFKTKAGLIRYVVEATGTDYAGMLHIFSPGQLAASPPASASTGEGGGNG